MQQQFGDNYYSKPETDEAFINHEDDDYFLTDVNTYDEDEQETEWNQQYDEEWDQETVGNEVKPKDKQIKNIVDEYLNKMDYEDLVAGIPCRFKYRTVPAESFGLTTEELLLADDTELNKYVSLKKISTYRASNDGTGGWSEGKLAKKRKRLRAMLRERLNQDEGETHLMVEPTELSNEREEGEEVAVNVNTRIKSKEVTSVKENGGTKKRVRPRRKLNRDGPEIKISAEGQVSVPQSRSNIEISSENTVNDTHDKKKKKKRNSNKGNRTTAGAGSGDAIDSSTKRRLSLYD